MAKSLPFTLDAKMREHARKHVPEAFKLQVTEAIKNAIGCIDDLAMSGEFDEGSDEYIFAEFVMDELFALKTVL